MNERIEQLALKAFQPINDMASEGIADRRTFDQAWFQLYNQKFAELIVEECRTVIVELYHKTPLELCGPLLTADEKITEHFYGVK